MTKGKHGGPGRGQGRKPIFDAAMPRPTLRLTQEHKQYIDNGGSERLRALLIWARENEALLVDDPGYSKETQTTVTLPTHLVELATTLGQKKGKGAFISGVRRVIASAISLGLDPIQIVAAYGDEG